MDPPEIIALIERYYNEENVNWGLQYVRDEHNVASGAARYLKLAWALLAGQEVPASAAQRPLDQVAQAVR
jgi:hypothetical protein